MSAAHPTAGSLCATRIAAAVVVLLPLTPGATMIDSFSEAPQVLQILPPPPPHDSLRYSVAELPGSVFDTRRLEMRFGGVQSLTVDTVSGTLLYELLEPPPDASGNNSGYFTISYQAAQPVDLLAGGGTGLRFSFASASLTESSIAFPASLFVDTETARGGYSWNYTLDDLLRQNGGAVDVDIPFTAFEGIDLTNVVGITFDVFRIRPGASIRLSSISVVPEPGTLSLMLACGVLLRLVTYPSATATKNKMLHPAMSADRAEGPPHTSPGQRPG